MDSDDSQNSSPGNESENKAESSAASSRSQSRGSARSRSSSPQNREAVYSGSPAPHSRSPSLKSRSPSPKPNQANLHSDRLGMKLPRSDSSPKEHKSSGSLSPATNNSPSAVQSRGYSSESNSSQSSSEESETEEKLVNRSRSRNSLKSGSSNGPSSREMSPKSETSRKSGKSLKSHSNKMFASKELNLEKSNENKLRSPSGDRYSVKSDSSHNSDKSSSSHSSRKSKSLSGSERSSRRQKKSRNDSSSDSSESSVDSSSRKNKNISNRLEAEAEEISDGDMESENEKSPVFRTEKKESRQDVINHEDLSDVSDLEDSMDAHLNDEEKEPKSSKIQTESNVENGMVESGWDKADNLKKVVDSDNRPEDGEEQLDFEAEDGECADQEQITENIDKEREEAAANAKADQEQEKVNREAKEREDLEEGELTDEDDVRPEETEPRPVCRFFSRGQCTWGASCRFLHPGVTDKGNYTMFEMIRPVVPGEFGREERFYGGRPEPPAVESAWERGLRTAKEMLKKSIKRKEQDIDFEEKKMNLSLTQEEFDKENGYYGRVPSPEPARYVRHVPVEYPPVARPPPEEYYNRRQVVYEPEYVAPPRERARPSYRELPTHRMPDYYNSKYEEEQLLSQSSKPQRINKPKREVIVQREERQTRADEWQDPWMRSKSPAGRKTNRKRSYSSGSTYSSSSSSHSSSGSSRSSYKSRSRSKRQRRSRSQRGRHVSPSVIVSERKAANERAAAMNPPAPRKKAPSPGMRVSNASNPPAPSKEDQFGRTKRAVAAVLAKVKRNRRSSRSSSDSSGSSSSDSDSSGSSSSSSREGSSPPRRSAGIDFAKAMDVLKGAGEKRQIKLTLKNPLGSRKADIPEISRKSDVIQGKKRSAVSPPNDSKSKKSTSRREELLKQLKAVEDAIAKKRSKVN